MSNDITALAQRLRVYAEEFSYPVLSPDDCRSLVEALEAKQPHHNGMMQLSNELVMAKQRIAELEFRTVTVKLPDSFYPDGDIELPLVVNEYQVIEALVAAGCKPVAVCPRCKRELDLSVKHDGAHYCHPDAGIQVIEGEQKNG
ncbi:hypothetical protein [Kluyvera ascorbata]|uniref:hypothetical protein n=1 Tax=Kluyvera ascorbata TaxID=51288 RepID=UPI002896E78E|nr:hypothetical protein [Kluyvera ascorbata]